MADLNKPLMAGQEPAINAGMAAEIERLRDELAQAREQPAGMAAEIERLRDGLAQAREQLAATSEVLGVIGRSASDLEGVLETVVESARKLCGADVAQVFLVYRDGYRLAYGS